MQDINLLKAKFNSPSKIVITTHHKPDGDALGSSLGMANYLIKRGHEVNVITPSDYPKFLHWMKGNDDVLVYDPKNRVKTEQLIKQADVIITLDFSVLSRIHDLGEMVREAKGFKVNVDHHLNPENFADFTLWNTNAAATCELCYELIVALGDESLIDEDIAECLYAGIMTDTGGFMHPNTTKNIHEVVAKLIQHGANISKVSKEVYKKNSINRLRFLGYALSQNLEVIEDLRVAFFALPKSELEAYNSKTGDTEGLVDYALSIEGVTLAALFKEAEGGVKVSLRSIGEFPANQIAGDFFNGGGHRNAAGGKLETSLEEAVEIFKSALVGYKDKLEEEYKRG